MDADDLESLGLYDPDMPNAEQRLAFLEILLDLGADLDQLRDLGPVDTGLWNLAIRPGRPLYTLEQAAERAGVDAGFARRVWRSAGLAVPDEGAIAFGDLDVELFSTTALGIELADEEAVVEIVRVMGAGLSSIAETSSSLYASRLAAAFVDDPEGAQMAMYNRALGREMLPLMGRAMETLLRHHMIATGRQWVDPGSAVGGYDTRDMCVGFADLVDSTTATNGLSSDAVGDLFRVFGDMAHSVVADVGGRVVKLIGDEVLFTTLDAPSAGEAALSLIDAAAADERLPSLRAGIAAGPVLNFQGDCFGPVVARAARIVGIAHADAVLVDAEIRALLSGVSDYRIAEFGTRVLKGFSAPVELFALGRPVE